METDLIEIPDREKRRQISKLRKDSATRISAIAEQKQRVVDKCRFYEGMMKEFPQFRPTREDYEFEEKVRMRSEHQRIEVGQIWEGQNQYGCIDKVQVLHVDTFDKSGGSGGCFDLTFEYTDAKGVHIPGKASWIRDHFHLLYETPAEQFQLNLFEEEE